MKRRFGLVLAAVALSALAGCNLAPEYARPTVLQPSGWKNAPAAVPVSWPSRDWWSAFDSATLERYIGLAQANNHDIGAAAARVLQAQAQVRIAGGSLWPSLNLSGGATRQYSERDVRTDGLFSRTRSDGPASSYQATLAASYELDFWGRNRNTLASAESLLQASRYAGDTVALTVTADLAVIFFQMLEAHDRLAIASENLANSERVLEIVEARFRNGAASPLEVAQQRNVVASQRAAIPTLQQQLSAAENALAVLVGQPPQAFAAAAGSLDAIALPPIQAGMPSEILLRRPDLREAEARLVAANGDIGVARAALFPQIDLTARYGLESAALGALFDPAGTFWTLAAGVTQSVFAGGALRGQVDLAEARYAELVQAYQQAVLAAFRDVEDALAAAQLTGDRQALQQAALQQAEIAFNLAETRYRAGVTDLLAVLDAQRTLFQAKDQVAQTKSARLQAFVSLYRALGGGWNVAPGE